MRILVSEFISLDGVVQAPGGPEEDTDGGFQHGGWSHPYFDLEAMGPALDAVLQRSDAILFGRRTYEVSAAAWPGQSGDPFSDKQVRLCQTFADQAVIAIENVRLFTELQARNHDLTEALEQQTATSDILQVISSSPTDLQPVFDIIAESAVKLCSAEVGLVVRLEGEWVHAKAAYGTSAAGLDAIRSVYPMRLSGAATSAVSRSTCGRSTTRPRWTSCSTSASTAS